MRLDLIFRKTTFYSQNVGKYILLAFSSPPHPSRHGPSGEAFFPEKPGSFFPFWTQHSEEPLYPEYVGSWYGADMELKNTGWNEYRLNWNPGPASWLTTPKSMWYILCGVLHDVDIQQVSFFSDYSLPNYFPSFYLFNHQVGNFQTTLDGWYKKKNTHKELS